MLLVPLAESSSRIYGNGPSWEVPKSGKGEAKKLPAFLEPGPCSGAPRAVVRGTAGLVSS